MDEEIKNDEELNQLPEVQFEEDLEVIVPTTDGIEVIGDDSLENYSEKEEEKESIELTYEEIKKLLYLKMKKDGNKSPITEEMLAGLTDEELVELKELGKIRDRKALIRFVNKKSHVTDEEAENLTEEEFLDLTSKALIMSRFLTYNTKKDFGTKYKKKRQRRNKMAKKSRAANHR